MWVELDIHGRVGVRIDAQAPMASQLRDMFAPFVTTGLERVDLTVVADYEPMPRASHCEHDYEYTDDAVSICRMKVQIKRDERGYRASGTREMLTTVLPLVDRIAVTHGAAMIHACTFELDGHGIAMPASGGVGKTSTMAKLMKMDEVAFMGDDWAFLSDDGRLLGFAKPMFIKPHHATIYPHLFAGTKKPMVPSSLSKPVGRLTTIVHPLVSQYPRMAAVSRRWSPEHMMTTPQRAFPGGRFSTEAPLSLCVYTERYDGSTVVLEERTESWMVDRMVGNFHCEMPLHSREVLTAMGASGLLPSEPVFSEKADVLRSAVAGKPCFVLQVPATMSADTASDLIVEHLQKAMAEAGLG